MNPEHISPAPSPSRTKQTRRDGELDAGQALGDSGLHGVDVTEDDLEALVKELGLTGADAEDLIKGLGGDTSSTKMEAAPPPPAKEDTKEEPAAAEPMAGPQKAETVAAEVEKSDVSKSEEPAVKVAEPEKKVDVAEEPTQSELAEKADDSPQEGTSASEKAKSEPAA